MSTFRSESVSHRVALTALQLLKLGTGSLLCLVIFAGCGSKQPSIEDPNSLRFVRLQHIAEGDYFNAPFPGLAPTHFESVAEKFAQKHQKTPSWLLVESETELIKALLENQADIAVGLLPEDASLDPSLKQTITLSSFEDWVIGRKLDGRFGVISGSEQENRIRKLYPQAIVVLFPPATELDVLADKVVQGEIDATVMPKPLASCFADYPPSSRSDGCSLRFSPKLKYLKTLSTRHYGWVVRTDSDWEMPLNAHLEESLLLNPTENQIRSWADIQKAGRLRMITRIGPTTYFLWKGEQAGYEFELLSLFASDHNLELDVIVGNRSKQFEDWLAEGRGDIISSSYTAMDHHPSGQLAFTQPYLTTEELVVSASPPIASLSDLAGRTLLVNPDTSYFSTLSALRGSYGFSIEERPHSDTESLINEALMAPNLVTVADKHLIATVAASDQRLAQGIPMGAEQNLVWAVGRHQSELISQLNAWLDKRQGTFDFNHIRVKYFQNADNMRTNTAYRISDDRLSEYDDIVKDISAEYGFDWRLITALIYQESEFNPRAISIKDARGLMQILPRTAREFGYEIHELMDPETNIRAGLEYLAWVRDRFDSAKPGEKMWFTLAGFNAGVGHVRDARRIARNHGDDPDRWIEHVENAILRLSEPRYYNQATYGYCRGKEPFNYVREIRNRYQAYVDHLSYRQNLTVGVEN